MAYCLWLPPLFSPPPSFCHSLEVLGSPFFGEDRPAGSALSFTISTPFVPSRHASHFRSDYHDDDDDDNHDGDSVPQKEFYLLEILLERRRW
uniref:Putative secreted protein n=1 Tax=Anopheles darlingi TaxID=43151 RepID=A0A2M4D7Q2_ANODA